MKKYLTILMFAMVLPILNVSGENRSCVKTEIDYSPQSKTTVSAIQGVCIDEEVILFKNIQVDLYVFETITDNGYKTPNSVEVLKPKNYEMLVLANRLKPKDSKSRIRYTNYFCESNKQSRANQHLKFRTETKSFLFYCNIKQC